MKRQPARMLEPEDVDRLLASTSETRHPSRNRLIVLLSFKAGLRACEISGLTWPMVLKTNGRIAEHLTISRNIAKYGSGRRIPMHPGLRGALASHHRELGNPTVGPLIASERGGHMTPRSIVNWFHGAYDCLDLRGCSTHSGRRTFITKSARAIGRIGGSLRDVQELAGHRALSSTEVYLVGDRDAQRKLINLI